VVRFGEVVEESGICGLDCVVFRKIGGDVDVWLVRIEHFEMASGEMVMGWGLKIIEMKMEGKVKWRRGENRKRRGGSLTEGMYLWKYEGVRASPWCRISSFECRGSKFRQISSDDKLANCIPQFNFIVHSSLCYISFLHFY